MRDERITSLLAAFHKAKIIDSNLQRKYQIRKGYQNASVYNPFVRKMQNEETNPFNKQEKPKRGHLSIEEKQRRRDKGLCMYCGAEGHKVQTCPLVPKN